MKSLTCLWVLFAAATSFFQEFDPMGIQRQMVLSSGNLLTQKEFRNDLKLSKEQGKAVDEIVKEHKKKQDEALKPGSNSNDFNAATAAIEKVKTLNDETDRRIAEVLTPEQNQRFRAIQWQCLGTKALYESDLQKALSLSDEQRSKISEHKKGEMGRLMSIMQSNRGAGMAPALKKAREESAKTLMGFLTPEQTAAYKAALGKELKAATRISEMVM
jgi:hypothetical protein